jgi:hypothetical protein
MITELISEIADHFERTSFDTEDGRMSGKQLRERGYAYDSLRFDLLANFVMEQGYEPKIKARVDASMKDTMFKPTMSEYKFIMVLLCNQLNILPEIIITHV